MYKLALYIFSLFVLFFACTQTQSDTAANNKQDANSIASMDSKTQSDIPTPTPIPPPNIPAAPVIKTVPQAAKKDLKYPKEYKDMGVSMYKGATIENNVALDNSQGKFGKRIKLTCKDSFEKVMEFYAKDLTKRGWTKNDQMDKVRRDEHVTYFSTNYTKDNYTLMHSVIAIGQEKVDIMQILKEN